MKSLVLANALTAAALGTVGVTLSNAMPERHGQICLANDSLITQSTYLEELTSFAIGYGGMSANRLRELRDFLAPARPSNSRTVRVTQYDETEPWQTVDYNKVKRALLGDFMEVRQRTATKVDRTIVNRGLTVRLDRDQLKDKPMWQETHTQWLLDLLMRASVLESVAVITAAATQDSATWDAASNPDLDLKQRLITLANITGFYPRNLAYGDGAALKRQTAYENQLTAGSLAHSMAKSEADIATMVGVDRVIVNAERYQSSASAKTEIIGNNALLFTSAEKESPEDPSNLVRHVANASYGGGEYSVYVTEMGVKTIFLTVENYELLALQHTSGLLQLAIN
jgi:hypothetical protein